MSRPQISVAKRQREQAKRERKQLKAVKRAERKQQSSNDPDIDLSELVRETPTKE